MVVSNICYFHPCLGKISNLTNILQRGWNHQLDKVEGAIHSSETMNYQGVRLEVMVTKLVSWFIFTYLHDVKNLLI